MILDEIHRGVVKSRKTKRLGRGIGSGQGKTAGRGHKGQGSRRGYARKAIFQGGTMPLIRRIPKRGFNNRWARTIAIVNVADLDAAFRSGAQVTPEKLAEANLARGCYDLVKVLGNGELKKKLKVSAHRFSKSAIEKIEKAGGEVTILPGPTPVEEKKRQKTKE